MSHTMNIKTEIRDREALQVACDRLGLSGEEGSFKFYDSDRYNKRMRKHEDTGIRHEGIGIRLKDWEYPIVVKDDGTIAYDNYDGQWGDIKRLEELQDAYALEKASMEARRQGYRVFETTDEQGNLQLRIRVGE